MIICCPKCKKEIYKYTGQGFGSYSLLSAEYFEPLDGTEQPKPNEEMISKCCGELFFISPYSILKEHTDHLGKIYTDMGWVP